MNAPFVFVITVGAVADRLPPESILSLGRHYSGVGKIPLAALFQLRQEIDQELRDRERIRMIAGEKEV